MEGKINAEKPLEGQERVSVSNEDRFVDGNRVVADCIRNLFMMDHSPGKTSPNEGVSLEKYYTEAIGQDQSGPESHSSTCSDRTNCDTDSWGESKYDEGLVEYPDDSSLEGNDSSSESSEDTVYIPQLPNQHLPYLNPALYALHTIMEESCEESDRESEIEENPANHLPSQLEKYFSLAFVSDLERKEVIAGRIPFDEVLDGVEESSPTTTKLSKEKESLALMASSRLEKYFTSGLLEGSSVSYPPDFSGAEPENVAKVVKTEENNETCHFEQDNSDTVKRRKAGEILDDPLLDLRNLFRDLEDIESVEEMQTYVPDEDNSCSYMLGKLMMHIKSSTQSNKNKSESSAEDLDALSLLESQISRLMQRVSPAHFANDEPSSTSSTCSSSTIGSTGNNSDCGSDTLESHEESTDEEGNLDAETFRVSTHKKRSYGQHRSHSRHNELLNNFEHTNISEETIYFCKQLVESLKRMSENNSPEGPKPPSLEATIEGLGVAAELTNARQYIKEQIESLMHSVTLSQQNSPASGRPHRPRRRVEAPSSSDAHDSSDVESPRIPNKKHSAMEKTPSESGSETTVSASISIPSYDDSDHTPTESEISHEMDELFNLLEGSAVTSSGGGVADYLPVPRIIPSDNKNNSIQVSMNGSKLMEEKKTENVMDIISSFGKVEPSTSKCLVNSEVAGFNVFVPNVAQASLEASKMKTYNSSLDSLDRDCLTPKAEVLEYASSVKEPSPTQIPVLSPVESSLSGTESKYSDTGSRETLVGSRADLRESYASVVSGNRLFRSKMTYYSSTSEVDDEESLGRTEADSGVGTPVPNSLNSKEKASSENNLLLANYRATTKSNKVVDTKSTSKSASNIMELDTSSENKGGGSCRDTGYYSFKSSEESVRSLDDSLASRASSISLVFHKSLTSTETIPEVEEDSCSLSGATNDSPSTTESGVSKEESCSPELIDSSKMSLSSGNIPDSVMVANPKSSTLPLNLRSKSHHLATNSLGSSHLRQRPFSSSFFSTSGVLRKLTALRDENAMAHRSSPRGRLRARGKALSTSSDDGINRASSGSVPQILVSDHLENNSLRGSQSLSDRESIGLPEDDVDQVVSAYSRSQTSLFGARSESMSSVYSAAGGGRYGAVIVTGEILFSLNYNCKAGHLALHVKECRNLAPVDTKRNRSDPYVKVYLLPDKTKGGKRKTKVKKHTLNPMFDEVLKFVVTNSELETRTMWLSVWHSDIFGRNDFLGEVMLPLSAKLVDTSQSLKWYPLQERMDANESTLSYKGDIILSLKFVPPDVTSKKPSRKTSNATSVAGTKGTLHVLVKEARNLMAIRSNGTSDPFCKSYLLPDKSKSGKQKTPVVKKSCNPKWNHTFVYEDISTEELKDRCLELTIWDYDKITSNDFLGGVRMNLGTGKHQAKDVDWMDALGEELVLWRSMIDRPNQWIDAALMLRPSMTRRS